MRKTRARRTPVAGFFGAGDDGTRAADTGATLARDDFACAFRGDAFFLVAGEAAAAAARPAPFLVAFVAPMINGEPFCGH